MVAHNASEKLRIANRSLTASTMMIALLMQFWSTLHAQQMVFPDEEWQVAAPESVLVDSQKLQAAINRLRETAQSVEEMLILRNGRVIWQGHNADYAHHVASVTKSFTTTVMGLLIDDGIVDLQSPMRNSVPSLDGLYPDATFAHFATHTSGYLAVDEEAPPGANPPQQVFTPGTPLFTPPGSQFAYTGVAMDMLANALTRVAGRPLQEFFTERIGEPIGFDPEGFDWLEFQADDGVIVDGGSGYADKGVVLSANNAARFGHLFLNEGAWNGQQLISREWVDLARQNQVPASIPDHPQSAGPGAGEYGYGWWVQPDWYEARGYGNNYVSINPDTGFVLARLGTEPTWIDWDAFKGNLLSAGIPAVWDGFGDGRWDEFDPGSGKPRWTTETGLEVKIYPTNAAIIRSNTVSVVNDLSIEQLTIESGVVSIAEGVSFDVTNGLDIHPKAQFVVDGTAVGFVADSEGILHVSTTGEVAMYRLVLDAEAQLTVDGRLRADRLVLRDGEAEFSSTADVQLDRISLFGGVLLLGGDFSAGRLSNPRGRLVVHDSPSPYSITEEFELSTNSELQFLLRDDAWDATFDLAAEVVPEFAGELVIEVLPIMNPSTLQGVALNLFDWAEGISPSGEFDRVVLPSRIQADLSRLYTTGEIVVRSVLEEPLRTGDFNGDEVLDVNDVDELIGRVIVSSRDLYYDVDSDGEITSFDLASWIHDLMGTWFGDANLDGEFNTGDLVQVLEAGKYETQDYASWSEGDWNGDGVFDTGDLVKALEDGGYELGPRDNPVAVPEPNAVALIIFGALMAFYRRRGTSVLMARF